MSEHLWFEVDTWGQPSPEDYPVVVQCHGHCAPTIHDEPGSDLPSTDRWCRLVLPSAVAPPPRPGPFRPMDTCPGDEVVWAINVKGEVWERQFFAVGAERVLGIWLGWCTPSEWADALAAMPRSTER